MMPEAGKRRVVLDRALLGLILAAGLAIRLYASFVCRQAPDFSDMGEYSRLAVEGLPHSFRPPLYPLFLRAIYSMFGAYNYRAVFVAQSVLSVLVILLLYLAASRLWSRRAGLIAAALTAIYPAFIAYNATTLTESLSILCVALMILTGASTLGDRRTAIIQGALAAFGILMKPAFVFFVPGLFATLRRRLVFVLVVAALLAPWLIDSAARRGALPPVSESGALMFYRSYNSAATGDDNALTGPPGATQMDLIGIGLGFIRYNPLAALDIVNNKVLILLSAQWDAYIFRDAPPSAPVVYALRYAYVVVLLLGFVGLARCYRRRHRGAVWPVASYLVLIILLSAFKVRYRVLIEPLLIVYGSILLAPRPKPAPESAPAAPRQGGT